MKNILSLIYTLFSIPIIIIFVPLLGLLYYTVSISLLFIFALIFLIAWAGGYDWFQKDSKLEKIYKYILMSDYEAIKVCDFILKPRTLLLKNSGEK